MEHVRDLADVRWLEGAPRARRIEVDGCMAIERAFYFGPESRFTPAEWREMREPVGVTLPTEDRWLPMQLALAHLDAVVEHHRRLLEIARRHGRPLRVGSPAVRLRPRIVGDEKISPAFAWVDTYAATTAVLAALCADRQGTLLDDVDQGWQLVARRDGEVVVLGERNWEDEEDRGRVLAVDRSLLVVAATEARARIDDVLTRLTHALGQDPWAFRTAGAPSL